MSVLDRRFYGWLGAATVSILGDAVLYFALGWTATGLGAGWAGLVLTAMNLPRAVLLLLGGAVGDRWGARRVMIAGDALMCGLTLALAVWSSATSVTGPVLVLVGLAIGTVGAFYLPATGSFPRLMVSEEQLPRALALRQSAAQIVGLLGGPAGGALVAAGGLSVIAGADAASFAVVLAVLLRLRPRYEPTLAERGTSVLRAAAGGVRLVLADPLLRGLLGATGLAAAFVLPMASLCVPLLVRGHGWSSSAAGAVIGVSACGGLAVSLVIARRGTFARVGLMTGAGLLVAAVGMTGVATGPSLPVMLGAALIQGAGNGLFVAHLAPQIMTGTASTHLARVQSVLVLVQSIPLLFSNTVVAAVAEHAGPARATLACAGGTAVTGLLMIARPRLRNARLASSAAAGPFPPPGIISEPRAFR